LEYYSISEVVAFSEGQQVLEIGGGYGRNAFVISTLNPGIQYTLVDVPPALYIAQRYLSAVFLDRKVFPVQEFRNYQEIRKQIDEASIVFLLPHQLSLLPGDHFSLCINISSFGEMKDDMIENYFREIDRITLGTFYTKQWKLSMNPFDRMDIGMDDYPIRPHWQQLYQREARVQSAFFEAAYRIGGRK
jgi:putative sugar O-methyltransferase